MLNNIQHLVLKHIINIHKYKAYNINLFNYRICNQIRNTGIATTINGNSTNVIIPDGKSAKIINHIAGAIKGDINILTLSKKIKRVPIKLYNKSKYIYIKGRYFELENEKEIADKLILNYNDRLLQNDIFAYVLYKRPKKEVSFNSKYLLTKTVNLIPNNWRAIKYNDDLKMIMSIPAIK